MILVRFTFVILLVKDCACTGYGCCVGVEQKVIDTLICKFQFDMPTHQH